MKVALYQRSRLILPLGSLTTTSSLHHTDREYDRDCDEDPWDDRVARSGYWVEGAQVRKGAASRAIQGISGGEAPRRMDMRHAPLYSSKTGDRKSWGVPEKARHQRRHGTREGTRAVSEKKSKGARCVGRCCFRDSSTILVARYSVWIGTFTIHSTRYGWL